jgi:2'-5' RNA ligase
MQNHYFIGIKIPSYIEKQVETFREQYQLRDHYKVIPHIDDLHVTLFYLGAVSDQNLLSLKPKLNEIADSHSPFSLNIDGVSYFGSASRPRVVYLSISEIPELSDLQKKIVSDVAKEIGIPTTNRFTPHVTIAKKLKSTDDLIIQKEPFQPIEVPVQEFSLFAVHPNLSPKYEAIETFQLRS